jgi:transcriptional regulator with XRE-family HTH domain
MKEKDLSIDCPYHQVVLYAEKEDGTFGPFQTGSYMTGVNISEHFKVTSNLSRSLTEQLKSGKISPVHYFMMLEGLNLEELAGRTGIAKFRVKRHLTLKGFRKMRTGTLKRYADVLNIPIANMFQIIYTIEDRNWDMGYQGEVDDSKTGSISQKRTNNPYVIETEVIRNTK